VSAPGQLERGDADAAGPGAKPRFEHFVENAFLERADQTDIKSIWAIRYDERVVNLSQRTQLRRRDQRRWLEGRGLWPVAAVCGVGSSSADGG
jgi:hypothetical protein